MSNSAIGILGVLVMLATACGTQPLEPSGNQLEVVEPALSTTNLEIDPDRYVLGQGDRIAIQVFDEPDLTMDALIGASGVINYSYLGDIRVASKSAEALEREITTLLSNGYLVNPSVNITVVNYRPFFINGEVRSPGGYSYQPGLTLDRAISLAGGLTERASIRKMFIQKASDKQKESKAEMQTRIAPGDIITIKEGFF